MSSSFAFTKRFQPPSMDINSNAYATHSNQTGGFTPLPTNLLEAFIPGYGPISKFLFEVFGFDVTIIVSVCLLGWGLGTSFSYLYTHAFALFQTYFMAFISIESDDEIFEQILSFLEEQAVSKDNLCLMAKTGSHSWDTDDVDSYDYDFFDGDLLNFSNWDAKTPPKFQPYFGKHKFWHKGRYFELKRETREKMMSTGWASIVRDEETIRLSCIGRSTQPIKDLIKECQDRYFDRKTSRTTVRRPATKEMRSMGRNPWTKVAKRPSRPMDTVVLDPDQKQTILNDINEYLHPASPRWYANRGIPYRRGYLFHGPPGTGKTSLSFAIAGIFGLDIFCISLLEPTLTEEDLGLLFNSLPRRCVVLLEDIDSAGLIRRGETPETETKEEAKEGEGKIGAEIAKAFKSVQDQNKAKDKTQGISLSGLLNAIDGVASHEGRVLVMTTNYPEKLDDALIRPGRVDMKVAFSLASHDQIHQLFIRMYSPDEEEPSLQDHIQDTPMNHKLISTAHEKALKFPKKVPGSLPTPPSTPPVDENVEPSDLSLVQIADRFSGHVPEEKFTPAEIQGFLLTRKKEPMKALREIPEWIEQQLEAKETKSKTATGAVIT